MFREVVNIGKDGQRFLEKIDDFFRGKTRSPIHSVIHPNDHLNLKINLSYFVKQISSSSLYINLARFVLFGIVII
jgi:hypothetical protein